MFDQSHCLYLIQRSSCFYLCRLGLMSFLVALQLDCFGTENQTSSCHPGWDPTAHPKVPADHLAEEATNHCTQMYFEDLEVASDCFGIKGYKLPSFVEEVG